MHISAKHIIRISALTTLLSGAGWYAWHWYNTDRFMEQTDDAYIQADVVDVRAEVPGRITRVMVDDNQKVHAGQILVQIDTADYRAKVDQAEARLAVARASQRDVSQQIALQERKIDEAQANIAAAKAEVRRADLELHRARKLERQSYGSKQRLQNAQAAAAVAAADLRQAQARYAAERQMQSVLQAKWDSAKANVSAARAGAEYARQQLRKTTIVAARDGVVGDMAARVGDIAQPALTLMRLVPIPYVYVRANFKETQIARMSIGQPVTIHVDAFPGVTFRGRVTSLSPATGAQFSLLPQDNATGNFNKIVQRVPVRIQVTAPAERLAQLRPGLSAVPEVDTTRFNTQVSYLDASGTNPQHPTSLARR